MSHSEQFLIVGKEDILAVWSTHLPPTLQRYDVSSAHGLAYLRAI
jgi:hypothetical protein